MKFYITPRQETKSIKIADALEQTSAKYNIKYKHIVTLYVVNSKVTLISNHRKEKGIKSKSKLFDINDCYIFSLYFLLRRIISKSS